MKRVVPLFALLAISSLDAMLLLKFAGNVAPLGKSTALEDLLEQSVLFLSPLSFLCH
jgi:hypothetical protein